MTAHGFSRLIGPLSLGDIKAALRDGGEAALTGDPDRLRGLLSWADVNRLLNISKLWSARTLRLIGDAGPVDPPAYCLEGRNRDGQSVWRPSPSMVGEHLARGATVVLSEIQTLLPSCAAAAAALQSRLGGPARCAAWCAQSRQQPVLAGFNAADTLIFNLDGVRSWRVFQGRFEHPADLPGYSFESLQDSYHLETCGAVAREVELRPGDGLLIPAGRYHDSPAGSGPGLYLAFDIERPTGLDFARLLEQVAGEDSLFRTAMPHFAEIEAHDAHFARLAERLPELLSGYSAGERMRREQCRCAFPDGVSGYALPSQEDAAVYRVRAGAKLLRRGKDWRIRTASGDAALSETEHEVADWAMARDFVRMSALADAFGDMDAEALSAAARTLAAAGLLERISADG